MSRIHLSKFRTASVAVLGVTALGLALGAQALTPRSSADINAELARAGYAEVREIEYDDGLWEAEVRRVDGRWGEIHVDPVSGEIFDRSASRPLLEPAALLQALQTAGYSAVDDLDREGATWSADATAPDGQRVELRISGYDGRVLHSEFDYED